MGSVYALILSLSLHPCTKCSILLLIFRVLILGQVMLLKQSLDLICAPKSVVDLAILGLPHRREFN